MLFPYLEGGRREMKAIVARLSPMCVSLVFVGLILTAQSLAEINPETIMGLWLFDEGTGKVTKDASGNGNDGDLVKEAEWVEGKFGKGIQFDGVDDGVNCGDIDALDFGMGDFTLCVWVKTAATSAGEVGNGWSRILDKHYTSGFSLMRSSGGAKVQFEVGGNATTTISTNPVFDDKWHHIAAVRFDDNRSRIYIDGKLDIEGNLVGGDRNNDAAFTMAYDAMDLGGNMKCSLDEVAVFNVALAGEDIERIATEGLSRMSAVSSAGKLATAWGAIKTR
jgi:hypothetical protein